ncbi:hypothetical protein QBC43DRAFT_238553 [Cladorrhinum sp. PSN259]|nr:hypothetical protein QBC43DRAFT_238553 [Cladorrhinum sp. PSN259]
MKSFTSAILLLAGIASANPVSQAEPRQTTPGPYQITEFFASKTHNSGYCYFEFNVTAPSLSEPVSCRANNDAGFSGAHWLAYIYEGLSQCTHPAVSFEFFQERTFDAAGTPGSLNVTIDGVKGSYTIPASQIVARENGPSPFDDDVSYQGPRNFEIVDFSG